MMRVTRIVCQFGQIQKPAPRGFTEKERVQTELLPREEETREKKSLDVIRNLGLLLKLLPQILAGCWS